MFEVSEVIFTAIEGLVLILAFIILSNRREVIFKNYIKTIIFTIIYTIYTYWITLFFPTGLHTILILCLTILTLNYILNGTLLKSTVKIVLITLAIAAIQIPVLFVSMLVTGSPIAQLLENDKAMLYITIICQSFDILAVFVLYKLNFTFSWFNDSNPYQTKYKQILILISSVLLFMAGINVYISNHPSNTLLFNMFSFIIYIVLIVAILFAFREGSKLEIIQYANELKKENVKQLIDFNEMVAKERHEYKNHLNTIYGLCTLNKQDLNEKVKHYINNYANNSDTRNLSIHSDNDFVDAIINVKYNTALKKGIAVDVDFDAPLSDARIDEDVAVTIISNILDNAFEAMSFSNQENKYIRLHTYIENDSFYISISNNGPVISDADRKKIFNAGYSTKDNASKTRGFGLSIVQTVVEGSGGSIQINSNEKLTEFIICLKLNNQKAAI